MAYDIPNRPDWLTDEYIDELKADLEKCPEPYADPEPMIICDGYMDVDRCNAHHALNVFRKYGIPHREPEIPEKFDKPEEIGTIPRPAKRYYIEENEE